jgi:hypothetical protein
MAQFTVGLTATSNSSINTQDLWIEIGGTTAATLKVKRVRAGYGSGLQSAGIDNSFLVQFYTYNTTTGGAPTTLTLPTSNSSVNSASGNLFATRNANYGTTVPAGLTVKVKNATTPLVLGTTSVQLQDQISPNGRALYEWLARDDDDMIVTTPAHFFAVALAAATASQVFTMTVDFIM